MRDRPRVQRGVLVYDADCSFCTRFATWSGPAVPWQELDLDQVGTTVDAMTREAGWLDGGRVTVTGAAAIAAALSSRADRWRWAGRVLHLPVVRLAAAVVYRVVARNRHRMPGGTAACEIPPSSRAAGPPRVVMVLAMVAIAFVGLGCLGYSKAHPEPYPGLMMPGFGYVPDDGHSTTTSTVTYVAALPDGSKVVVPPERLIPATGSAAYVMVQRVLGSDSADRVGVRRWLAGRLDGWSATRGAVSLTVVHHSVTFDADSHAMVDDQVSARAELALEDVR